MTEREGVEGDFVRSANPGDPEWEAARTVLVQRLREIGLCKVAYQVSRGEPADIQSWLTLELMATPALPTSSDAGRGDRESVARIIDPSAWGEIGHDDYLRRADEWYAKGRTSPGDPLVDGYREKAAEMVKPSLAKADAILALPSATQPPERGAVEALPVGTFTGSGQTVTFDDGRFVTVGFGKSEIFDPCWMLVAGKGGDEISMGLSDEAMDAIVSIVVGIMAAQEKSRVSTPATNQAGEVELLRELSDAATPGPWFQGYGAGDDLWNGYSQSRHNIWPDHLGVGRLIARTGTDFTGWMKQDDANASFIVACVGYVRAALAAAPHIEREGISPGRVESAGDDRQVVPAGMVPWAGGDSAPDDWDGKTVMFRSGKVISNTPGTIWKLGWGHHYGIGDVVAYTPSAAAGSRGL